MEHKLHQDANDWVTCKCGELFSDDKKSGISKWEKLKDHELKKNYSSNHGLGKDGGKDGI